METGINPLRQLGDHGQSYWLDNLTRSMLASGELARRVAQDGLRGVTSNPTIFYKAVSGYSDYDEAIRELSAAGVGDSAILERLTTDDVRSACDVLRPAFDRSEGREGFVSLEVSPHLARDTDGSVKEAHRLWQTVDRPNLMIKIPGTAEGVPAIEQLLFDGVNVNITLLFSIDAYAQVAEAYLRALERRLEAQRPLSVNSVASFFLSRIDTLVDKQLEAMIDTESPAQTADPRPVDLLGRVGVASAKLAYQRFLEFLRDERWKRLEGGGASPQQILWASTSTKNPHYPDTLYVEPLIGPWTINTMTEQTIAAFADHGKVADTIEQNVPEARQVIEDLGKLGIDINAVTRQLLEDGIQKFIEPYDALSALIERKRETFRIPPGKGAPERRPPPG